MNIWKRTLTAFVLLPLVFLLIQFSSPLFFFVVIQVVVLLALNEFYNLSIKKRIYPKKGLGFLFSLIIGLTFLFKEFSLGLALMIGLLMFAVGYLLSTKSLEELMAFPTEISLSFFGALYLSFTLNHINLIRQEYGPFYLYFLFAIIFTGDTLAFLVGKKWGKHQIASLASPNKTWEGSAAGFVSGMIIAVIAAWVLFGTDFVIGKVLLMAIFIQVMIQLSDPLESMFKRAAGVKDSSHLLPGHGGFLDRTDSMVLAFPVFFYLMQFLGIS
ncbi:MAG: phosphatidate cytidylyltransferase [Candidatus Aminicenantes bacterium]|nr:phosphatidate cytidylyltransferase [Candidatus Aminicenantes bacterium]